MQRSTLRVIIPIAVILIFSLFALQSYWVKRAWDLQEKHLNFQITQALKNVAQQVLISNNDSTILIDPVQQVKPAVFKVRIHETIDQDYLAILLEQEFAAQEIPMDMEYSIYDCFNDSVIFRRAISLEGAIPSDTSLKFNSPTISFNNDGHYFSVYFPTKSQQIIGQMQFWMFSSGVILLLLFFFSYTIYVILKQKKLSEIKTDFINNMTHELQTPISTIMLSSKALMKPEVDPDRLKNYAEIIRGESIRLKNLVEKVLQISTLNKLHVSIEKQPVDIHEIIEHVVKVMEISTEDKKAELNTKLLATESCFIGDKTHLQNVVNNLLDNALKYSSDHPVINIRTRNTKGHLFVEIADNGIGIDAKDQLHVFDRFYRVPKGNLHDVKGFGLGLYYVKKVATAHGGSVSVQSTLGKGSTFTLKFPIQ